MDAPVEPIYKFPTALPLFLAVFRQNHNIQELPTKVEMEEQQDPKMAKPAPCLLPLRSERSLQETLVVRASPNNSRRTSAKEVSSNERYWSERCMNLERKIAEMEQAIVEDMITAYNRGYNDGIKEGESRIAENVRKVNEGLNLVVSRASLGRQGSDEWDEICRRAV